VSVLNTITSIVEPSIKAFTTIFRRAHITTMDVQDTDDSDVGPDKLLIDNSQHPEPGTPVPFSSIIEAIYTLPIPTHTVTQPYWMT
jgi:hypothetical protein